MIQTGTPKQLFVLIVLVMFLTGVLMSSVHNSSLISGIKIPKEAMANILPQDNTDAELPQKPEIDIKITHTFNLTNDMTVLSQFIQKENFKMPSVVTDIIAYNIYSISEKEKVPVELVIGIMKVESNFDPTAISKVNAKGLMQVLNSKCTTTVIDKSKIFEIDYNIETGICIFKEHLSIKNGDVDKALYGYVGGDKKYPTKIYKAMAEYTIFVSSASQESSLHSSNFKK